MTTLLRYTRAATIVLAILAAAALLPEAGRATRICDDCASTNDTTATPGKSATGRDLVERALFPHIAFVGKDSMLRCARTAEASWHIEVVNAAAKAAGVSVAFDALREPMIAYHDQNGMLWLARPNGPVWTSEPVDPSSFVLGSTSIARTPAGAAIAYVDADSGLLKYAERLVGGGWDIQTVAPAAGAESYPSLVYEGTPRAISYYDAAQGDLRLARSLNGAPWTTELVDGAGDVGGYSSLVGNMTTGFGIAYYDFTSADLRYARQVPGGWLLETVDGVGESVGQLCSAVALAGNPDDHVGIAYYDRTHRRLKYALKTGPWSIMTLDATDDAGGSGIACGGTPLPADTAGVAYIDRANGDLEYARIVNGVASVPLRVGGEALRVEWLRASHGAGGRVRFRVPEAGPVRVALYDAQGRLTAVPLSQTLPAGEFVARWDGLDARGRRAPAGVFFVRVETARAAGTALAVVLR